VTEAVSHFPACEPQQRFLLFLVLLGGVIMSSGPGVSAADASQPGHSLAAVPPAW